MSRGMDASENTRSYADQFRPRESPIPGDGSSSGRSGVSRADRMPLDDDTFSFSTTVLPNKFESKRSLRSSQVTPDVRGKHLRDSTSRMTADTKNVSFSVLPRGTEIDPMGSAMVGSNRWDHQGSTLKFGLPNHRHRQSSRRHKGRLGGQDGIDIDARTRREPLQRRTKSVAVMADKPAGVTGVDKLVLTSQGPANRHNFGTNTIRTTDDINVQYRSLAEGLEAADSSIPTTNRVTRTTRSRQHGVGSVLSVFSSRTSLKRSMLNISHDGASMWSSLAASRYIERMYDRELEQSLGMPALRFDDRTTRITEEDEDAEQMWLEASKTILDSFETPSVRLRDISRQELRYLAALFLVKVVHSGYLNYDLIVFPRAAKLDDRGGDVGITVRFLASFVVSVMLLCLFCQCLGDRVLHVRGMVSVALLSLSMLASAVLWETMTDAGGDSTAKYALTYTLMSLRGGLYAESFALCGLVSCVVFADRFFSLSRTADMMGLMLGDVIVGTLCSATVHRWGYTGLGYRLSIAAAVVLLLALIVMPAKLPGCRAALADSQKSFRCKFGEFCSLLRIPRITILCLHMLGATLQILVFFLPYNLYFTQLYGANGARYFTIFFFVTSLLGSVVSVALGVRLPGHRTTCVIVWATRLAAVPLALLTEPPAGWLGFTERVEVKIPLMVIACTSAVPYKVYCLGLGIDIVSDCGRLDLVCNVCLLLNIADMLARLASPVTLSLLNDGLGLTGTLAAIAAFGILVTALDIFFFCRRRRRRPASPADDIDSSKML